MDKIFLAGASSVEITPPMGTVLGVDFLNHYARYIHDPLYAKALVLKDARITLALLVVDICIMDTDLMTDVKKALFASTGIPMENIMISADHTHGAGNVVGLLGSHVDIAYRKKLPGLMVKAVEDAQKNMRPARMASGAVDVPDFMVCRRYIMKEGFTGKNPVTGERDQVKTNPVGLEHLIESRSGQVDPGLGFLAVKSLDDRWIAVFANYSLHYAADWHDDSVTADFFGEFAGQMKKSLNAGDDFVAIMSNGTSGDVNIWDFMEPDRMPKGDYERTRLIGSTLAQKLEEQIKDVQWDHKPTLAVAFRDVNLGVRKPSSAELEIARLEFIDKGFDGIGMDEEGFRRVYGRETLLLNEYPDHVNSPVQVLRLGDLFIGALGGEIFGETGVVLKEKLKEVNYFTISLANTYGGYIPPAHEFEKGGYETWRARSSFLETGSEKKLKETVLALVRNLI